MKLTLILLVLLLLPTAAFGAASQLTVSYQDTSTKNHKSAQLVRCNDALAAGSETVNAGEDCEAGDWTLPLDCRGTTSITVTYHEYGTTSTAKVWSCVVAPAAALAPGGTPTVGTPDPLCVELSAAKGVTLSGTTATSQGFSIEGNFGFIVGEIDAESSSDSTLAVSCTLPQF